MSSEQKILLAIIKTWDIKSKPEFRGFRCANCNEYMESAWHHWLHTGGFRTPLHFCDACEESVMTRTLKIPSKDGSLHRVEPGFAYSGNTLEVMKGISAAWEFKVEKKQFTCDMCQCILPGAKAWHVWIDLKKDMVEEHFCKECGKTLGMK